MDGIMPAVHASQPARSRQPFSLCIVQIMFVLRFRAWVRIGQGQLLDVCDLCRAKLMPLLDPCRGLQSVGSRLWQRALPPSLHSACHSAIVRTKSCLLSCHQSIVIVQMRFTDSKSAHASVLVASLRTSVQLAVTCRAALESKTRLSDVLQDAWVPKPGTDLCCEQECLTLSLEGRRVDMITITQASTRNE
eukprot:4579260-Amphidinium_carterae.2